MKFSTTEEFIKKAKTIHGDKYDYSKVNYVNAKEKVCIICPIHGEFLQTPNNHLSGQGCPKCGAIQRGEKKLIGLKYFIERAKQIHGDKYDYSKVQYINMHTKVCIICPEHGEFWQIPNSHLSGRACPKCSTERAHALFRKSTEQFIEEAKKVHGDKYDYSKVEYIGNKEKICIICPEHGEFWQSPIKHLKGNGCQRCIRENANLSFNEFVEKANKIHNNKYQYDDSAYVNQRTKIKIICPEHGEFWQAPYKHIKEKQGCPRCGGRYPINTSEFIWRANKIHMDRYDYSKVKYVNYETKVCIICPEHGEFWQTPDSHLHGAGCPKCNVTRLERKIMNCLNENKIKYKFQYTFKWLRNKGNLFYDFYLPQYKAAIECQGVQHFIPVDFFGGEEALKYTQSKDETKETLSKKHGIKVFYYSDLNIDYPYSVYKDIDKLIQDIKMENQNGITFDERMEIEKESLHPDRVYS